jgi:nitrogen regulatory protein P-II 2
MEWKLIADSKYLYQRDQLPDVKNALFESGIRQMTASTVMGTAAKSEQQRYRGVQREVSLFNRTRLEIAIEDSMLETAIKSITKGAKESGGSGKIFVTELLDAELLDAITVWTGDRGDDSLKQKTN